MLVQMSRHGARIPFASLRDDLPYQNVEELTNVGFRQHYIAGQFLRKRYPTLFSRDLNNSEIIIRSSNLNRTFQSASANLMGTFDKNDPGGLPHSKNDPR